jgi:four helix bundle protein
MTEREQSFENLECYQKALQLYIAAYRLAAKLPDHERYNLASQIRRSSLSILLNIAEGYGRYHYLDKLKFFYIARGSLQETLSAFVAANSAAYLDEEQMKWVRDIELEIEKALNGYIGFIRKQAQGHEEYGAKYIRDDLAEYNDEIPDVMDDE